jgi:hypothetical protein
LSYWFSILSPRNVLHLLRYTRTAFEPPLFVCQAPAVCAARGNLISLIIA